MLNPEIAQYFEARKSRIKPVKTTTTRSGQILDWVPVESQVADGKIATPPPAPVPLAADEKINGIRCELDDPNVERGPAGTVPILRKNLSALHTTRSLRDYLSKRGGLLVNPTRKKGPTDPNPFGYFHGTSGQSVTAVGCEMWLDVWDPYVQTGDDHSIMQCGLQNYDNPQLQSLEAGWTVDNSLNGDWIPHLFTYYTTNGYTSDGDNIGGYNTDVDGWVQVSDTVYPGIGFASPYSSRGGTQYGFSLRYHLGAEGENWWLWFQGVGAGTWVGYYPCWLFEGGPGGAEFKTLGYEAEWVGFWGEVYSSLSNPKLSTTQMGSGQKAEKGYKQACFQKSLTYQPTGGGSFVDQIGSPSAEDPSKYDINLFNNSGGTWGTYFYAGGS